MSKGTVKVEGIGKKYKIGTQKRGELRESIDLFWNRLRNNEKANKSLETELNNVRIQDPTFWALKDINFEIKQGEAVGIIGRNGAGKSTLLKILSRITKPTTGKFEINGRVSSLLEVGTGFHMELTGRENIFLNGTILGMKRREIRQKFDEIVDFSGVEKFIDTPVKHYSSGMKVRLAFSVAAHLEPEILIIDEVLAVGDAEFQKKCLGKMEDVTGQGRTVIFVSHNMGAVRNLCGRGILLRLGKLQNDTFIDDVIAEYNDFFLEKENKEIQNSSSEFIRMEGISQEIYFSKIELLSRDVNSTSDIKIRIVLKAVRQFRKIRIAGTIVDYYDNAIGSFFSNNISLVDKYKEEEYILTIKQPYLAKGRYKMNFSVGVGDYVTGIKDYDRVLNVLSFQISHFSSNQEVSLSNWDPKWGPFVLQAKVEGNE